jgi:hypothetical protein
MLFGEHKRSKANIVRDEDTRLVRSSRQNVLIRDAGGVVRSDCGDIVPEFFQMSGQADIDALVDQESHAVAATIARRVPG